MSSGHKKDKQCEATIIVGGGLGDHYLMRCDRQAHSDELHAYANVGRIPAGYHLLKCK